MISCAASMHPTTLCCRAACCAKGSGSNAHAAFTLVAVMQHECHIVLAGAVCRMVVLVQQGLGHARSRSEGWGRVLMTAALTAAAAAGHGAAHITWLGVWVFV